ncbi:MAG: aminotransferase class V-fold PLP-dependent enzyme [Acidobacteriota bacterium]
MMIHEVRQLFPVTRKWVYMNHAAVAPLSSRVVSAVESFMSDQLENGGVNWKVWCETYTRARSLVGRLINAGADEISFVKNTSEGVSLIANGLDLAKGDSVALPETEFPSNVYPWLALQERGVGIDWIPEREGRIEIEDVRSALLRRPKALAISFVEFLSGYRNDLLRIGKLCREFDVFFFVDGIQGLGALPLDVQEAGVDALASDSKKWLLGPEGAGFMFVSRERTDRIRVVEHGWMSVKNPNDYFSHQLVPPEGALRYEPGSLNTAGIHGLAAALELIEEIGLGEITSRIMMLTDRLVEGLRSKGYLVLSPRGPGESSGIVSFSHPKWEPRDLEARLRAASVVCANRLGYIRLSPHYYLTEAEIDLALRALP